MKRKNTFKNEAYNDLRAWFLECKSSALKQANRSRRNGNGQPLFAWMRCVGRHHASPVLALTSGDGGELGFKRASDPSRLIVERICRQKHLTDLQAYCILEHAIAAHRGRAPRWSDFFRYGSYRVECIRTQRKFRDIIEWKVAPLNFLMSEKTTDLILQLALANSLGY